ncbi:hypothetical protein PFICI_12688 [Pestalotiopsis fici W106-1]|uniref:Aquaporin-1 n=1 Tax=Pestalotiopsis fici (strain W106-1 / CGMCC3.15140) TaxID=1229662 RepID=W3WPN5_PESFW|nr:uncharacterized protein PFICI_12688 [Pestalotiopsis fici W106-1]ETS75744.1 hypothetical protein PFICI_12688 [Pestalotiopsis fici W106-1]
MSNDMRMRLLKSNHPANQGSRRGILKSLPVRSKNHIVAAGSEFIGTFLFLFFAFAGAQTANTAPGGDGPADPARLLFIALSFGISLAVNVWVFFRVSGGLFNPAVSLAMVLAGAMDAARAVLVVPAQLLGGVAAAAVVGALLPGPLAVGTALGAGISVGRALVLEMLLTAELVLTIFMLAAEKHRGTFMAPVGIGLSLFVAHLAGVYYTGASLNPARSLGPAVVTGHFPSEHWIYWIGPILGSLLASLVYLLVKAVDYTTVNPAQDAAGGGGDDNNNNNNNNNNNASREEGHASHDIDEGGPSRTDATGSKGRAYEQSPRLEDGEGSRATQ